MKSTKINTRTGECSYVQVFIQKPDLDTCLTGLILGVEECNAVTVAFETIPEEMLLDPAVLCIEAGGSGQTHLNNFDHHEPGKDFPPACRQAYLARGLQDEPLARLVSYVSMVDNGNAKPSQNGRMLYLSNIFSGLLLCTPSPLSQFAKGMCLLREVLARGIDPYGTMPSLTHWEKYHLAWLTNKQRLLVIASHIELFRTVDGKLAGFLANPSIGGFGHLYRAECEVAILYNPVFGPNGIPKYTIGSAGKDISHLLPVLNSNEPGWGGRATIIGSPRNGSALSPEFIKETVRKNC